jgi:hypothetical protein
MKAFRHDRGRQPSFMNEVAGGPSALCSMHVIRFVRQQAEGRLEGRRHDRADRSGFGIRRTRSIVVFARVGRRCVEEEGNPAGVADVERAQCERVLIFEDFAESSRVLLRERSGRTFKMKCGVSITCQFESIEDGPRMG